MFDWFYGAYVNYQTVRAAYAAGFLLTWASWADKSLNATPPETTWLVFGWLPAVFWPVQALVNGYVPYLLEIWKKSYHIGGEWLGLSFNYDLPWGMILILGAVGFFLWQDVSEWLQLRASAA